MGTAAPENGSNANEAAEAASFFKQFGGSLAVLALLLLIGIGLAGLALLTLLALAAALLVLLLLLRRAALVLLLRVLVSHGGVLQ